MARIYSGGLAAGAGAHVAAHPRNSHSRPREARAAPETGKVITTAAGTRQSGASGNLGSARGVQTRRDGFAAPSDESGADQTGGHAQARALCLKIKSS